MIDHEADDIYSVSTLTRELKELFDSRYRFVKVQGEISNLSRPFSGHAYFTLKDEGAQLRGVLFKGQAHYLQKDLGDGQQVTCHGRISIYEPRGEYQLIVDTVDFVGSGLLQRQFEQLKQQLKAEGLFAAESKQALPPFPKEIVLLTSPSGAAVHDFLKIWKEKNFPTHIKIFPVRVQGTGAAQEIAQGLATINRLLPNTDIVVLCRGGGSLEDLWPFNEEVLARAIFRSILPVVSAVGHEVDFSISDFCADMRAPTPTAAAEMLIADGRALTEKIQGYRSSLKRILLGRIADARYKITQNRRLLGDMDSLFTNTSLRLDHAAIRLAGLMKGRIERSTSLCHDLSLRLESHSPVNRLSLQQQRLAFVSEKLLWVFKNRLVDKGALLARQAALLDAVSPLATMARGYAITTKIDLKTGKRSLVTKSNQLAIHDQVEIRLHQGRVACEVLHLSNE